MPVYTISVVTTGADGSASGSNTSHKFQPGTMLEAIQIDYHASAPGATTDITVTEADGLERTLLSVTNSATDGTYYPRHGTHDTDGSDSSGADLFIVEGALTVSVAGCNALDPAVQVSIQTVANRAAR